MPEDNEPSACETRDQDSSPADLTRRLWLRTIGQAAGSLGLLKQFETEALTAETTTVLPPGLYEASRNHLSHAMMQNGRFRIIPPDCPTDYVVKQAEPYSPKFFSQTEFASVRRIVQLMLDEALTTEADVVEEVAEWIDLEVSGSKEIRAALSQLAPEHRLIARAHAGSTENTEGADAQDICREGLAWLTKESQSRYAKGFQELEASQQLELLHNMAGKEGVGTDAGSHFFTLVKTEVIRGFYTSQAGLKELNYKGNGFYATSPGCPK